MNYETTMSGALDGGMLDDERQAKRRRLIIIAIVVAVLAIGAAAYFMSGSSETTAAADAAKDGQAQTVTVVAPGRDTVVRSINATGTLAARRETPVGVVGEGGAVTRVFVDAGDWVRQGQVMVSVDRSVQVQQAAALDAQIGVARSDLQLAQAELDRAAQLIDRGFISKADVDRKTATRDAAASARKRCGGTARRNSRPQRAA